MHESPTENRHGELGSLYKYYYCYYYYYKKNKIDSCIDLILLIDYLDNDYLQWIVIFIYNSNLWYHLTKFS